MYVILDLIDPINETELELKIKELFNLKKCKFISFTPYSTYLLEKLNYEYEPISKFYKAIDFKKDLRLLSIKFFNKYPDLKYYKYIYNKFFSYILQDNFKYEFILKLDDYIYITDRKIDKKFVFNDNKYSLFLFYLELEKIIFFQNKIENKNSDFLKKLTFNNLKKVCKLLINKIKFFTSNCKINLTTFNYDLSFINLNCIENLSLFSKYIHKNNKFNYELDFFDDFKLYEFYKIQLNSLILLYNINLRFDEIKSLGLVELGDSIFDYTIKKEIFSYNIFVYTYQHGSYLYHTEDSLLESLYETEILFSNLNFVFNDYTKNLFDNLGAKKVYSVGSVFFNKKIKERKKEYDFLYIIQAHDYLGNLQYVDFENSLHSFDGYELYQRHKHIIKLFGEKFKDKKIVIRVHPLILTSGVYVPFWELAKGYSNITIDISIPIHTLIEKSKYIISDYFTSEFINRKLHYKRDIILFQGVPTPLPKETIEDMKKMFILVDTVDDLENTVNNIVNITKNRKRYDDIIEYYSSKKCDTKKLVNEILKKELVK